MLSYGHVLGTKGPWTTEENNPTGTGVLDEVYEIPGKLGDTFGIVESFPGYGHAFMGGPVIDLLLWFTDYHHFHSPVAGKVVYANDFMGSHQYDFDNFNPNFPFGKSIGRWYLFLYRSFSVLIHPHNTLTVYSLPISTIFNKRA